MKVSSIQCQISIYLNHGVHKKWNVNITHVGEEINVDRDVEDGKLDKWQCGCNQIILLSFSIELFHLPVCQFCKFL